MLARAGVAYRMARPPRGEALVVVASYGDMRMTRHRRHVLVEHGAGQAYQGIDHGGYSGGRDRDSAVLFVCPNAVAAGRNAKRYPDAGSVIAAPRVEALRSVRRSARHGGERNGDPEPAEQRDAGPAVALSFHWPSPAARASGTALRFYVEGLPAAVDALRASGVEVLGHGHPRAASRMRRLWARMGVEWVGDFAEVVARADAYACDNSSTMFEAAACGIPVVVLESPDYEGEASWPRFAIGCALGPRIWSADLLPQAVLTALADPEPLRTPREWAARQVFPEVEGSAVRVAEALAALQ